jgi:hypothetical protein
LQIESENDDSHVSGGLRSLTNLNKLKGYLEISHLEQVKFSPSKEGAEDEFLINKQNLERIEHSPPES